jgi:hypothetical protein
MGGSAKRGANSAAPVAVAEEAAAPARREELEQGQVEAQAGSLGAVPPVPRWEQALEVYLWQPSHVRCYLRGQHKSFVNHEEECAFF